MLKMDSRHIPSGILLLQQFTHLPMTMTTVTLIHKSLIFVLITLSCMAHIEGKRPNDPSASTTTTTSSSSIFIQLPYSSPPTVKSPPYFESDEKCPAMNLRENWVDTLCGDLNAGYIPKNPMGHAFPDGSAYPFDLIKDKALEFFRRVLPILKDDKSLPKVAKYNPQEVNDTIHHYRMKRSTSSNNSNNINLERLTWLMPPSENATTTAAAGDDNEPAAAEAEPRSSNGIFTFGPRRGQQLGHNHNGRFCENVNPMSPGAMTYFHRFCKLYNSMWGKHPYHQSPPLSLLPPVHSNALPHGHGGDDQTYHQRIMNGPTISAAAAATQSLTASQSQLVPQRRPHPRYHRYEALHTSEAKIEVPPAAALAAQQKLPPTPCPSQVEYLSPVFARNHEGSWRYIVQIPREGYFTQTVEITKCTESHCFYMDGDCKSSPRWQSLLVAEVFYPDTSFPTTTSTVVVAVADSTSSGSSATRPLSPLLLPVYENSNENSEYHKYQQYLKKQKKKRGGRDTGYWSSENYYGTSTTTSTAGTTMTEVPPECDGIDHIGCFQVRLFYDWFLIPGSCQCWRRTFDFTRVHNNNNRL